MTRNKTKSKNSLTLNTILKVKEKLDKQECDYIRKALMKRYKIKNYKDYMLVVSKTYKENMINKCDWVVPNENIDNDKIFIVKIYKGII